MRAAKEWYAEHPLGAKFDDAGRFELEERDVWVNVVDSQRRVATFAVQDLVELSAFFEIALGPGGDDYMQHRPVAVKDTTGRPLIDMSEYATFDNERLRELIALHWPERDWTGSGVSPFVERWMLLNALVGPDQAWRLQGLREAQDVIAYKGHMNPEELVDDNLQRMGILIRREIVHVLTKVLGAPSANAKQKARVQASATLLLSRAEPFRGYSQPLDEIPHAVDWAGPGDGSYSNFSRDAMRAVLARAIGSSYWLDWHDLVIEEPHREETERLFPLFVRLDELQLERVFGRGYDDNRVLLERSVLSLVGETGRADRFYKESVEAHILRSGDIERLVNIAGFKADGCLEKLAQAVSVARVALTEADYKALADVVVHAFTSRAIARPRDFRAVTVLLKEYVLEGEGRYQAEKALELIWPRLEAQDHAGIRRVFLDDNTWRTRFKKVMWMAAYGSNVPEIGQRMEAFARERLAWLFDDDDMEAELFYFKAG